MKFKFKSYSGQEKPSSDGPEAGEDSPANRHQKRKDQLRKAQKSHRERKEAYIKSLELEVLQLRTREANILKENGDLHLEVNILRETLAKHGIALPSTTGQCSQDQQSQDSFEINLVNLSGQISKTRRPKMLAKRITPNSNPADQQPEITPTDTTRDTSSVFSLTSPDSIGSPSQASPNIYLGNLDLTAIGISFVLSLEEPCLPHLISSPSSFPSDHAHSLGATLLHPHINSLSLTANHPQNRRWRIHSTEIERLLELSNEVALDTDEITPVQAWDQIRKHPEIREITLERLEGLRAKLAKAIACYGFGGVVKVEVFEKCMFETFVVGRVF